VHLFQEHPLVIGKISDCASLGGLKTGLTYRMGIVCLTGYLFKKFEAL